ncbi:hypothetical protein D3C75_645350 [compost metagenome]
MNTHIFRADNLALVQRQRDVSLFQRLEKLAETAAYKTIFILLLIELVKHRWDTVFKRRLVIAIGQQNVVGQ